MNSMWPRTSDAQWKVGAPGMPSMSNESRHSGCALGALPIYRVGLLAQRKPVLKYRLSGAAVFRNAVLLLIAKPDHDPPRITFLSPIGGPPGFLSGEI